MMAETYIAIVILAFALGTLAGLVYAWMVYAGPVERELEEKRRAELRAYRQRVYRAEYRRQHLGTPYIRTAPSSLERLLADIADSPVADDHNGSRRAPELRGVS